MYTKKMAYLLIVLSGLMFLGCGGGSSTADDSSNTGGSIIIDDDSTTVDDNTTDDNTTEDDNTTTLSQELMDSITYMYSEEGLAYDVYMNIYKEQPVKQLLNIATNSETKHIALVNELAIKYDLNITQYPDTDHPYSTDDLDRYGSGEYPVEQLQELYNLLYDKGIQSEISALEVGCMVEVVDIDDLDEYIALAERDNATDVLAVFNQLITGSYSHYWTFHQALINKGVSDGCCSLGEEYCHLEYPQ